jgi:uncharacterized membrane protein YfcA
MILNFSLLPVFGLAIGLLMGLTGAGGGILSVPVLVLFVGLNISEAGPISLMAIAASSSVGALLAFKTKSLRYKAAGLIAMCGVSTAPIGIYLARQFSNELLTSLFGLMLMGVSLRSYLQTRGQNIQNREVNDIYKACRLNPETGKFVWTRACFRVMISIGALAGFFSGLFGVGGGFVIVPALEKYTNLSQESIINTSIGVMAVISMGSVLLTAYTGTLNLVLGTEFSLGAIAGLIIGRQFSKYLNSRQSQQIFSIFAFGVAIYMILKSLFNLIGT